MKVFRFNEFDYVAAHSFEEGLKWYMDYYGLSKEDVLDELYAPYEIDPEKATMWCHYDDVPLEERENREKRIYDSEVYLLATISEVLRWDNKNEPYLVCSREY